MSSNLYSPSKQCRLEPARGGLLGPFGPSGRVAGVHPSFRLVDRHDSPVGPDASKGSLPSMRTVGEPRKPEIVGRLRSLDTFQLHGSSLAQLRSFLGYPRELATWTGYIQGRKPCCRDHIGLSPCALLLAMRSHPAPIAADRRITPEAVWSRSDEHLATALPGAELQGEQTGKQKIDRHTSQMMDNCRSRITRLTCHDRRTSGSPANLRIGRGACEDRKSSERCSGRRFVASYTPENCLDVLSNILNRA